MAEELDPTVRWELSRLAKLDVLEEGEVLRELEDAMLGDRLGALVVTDRRVMFVNTGVIRRKTHVRSVPLPQIEAVETAQSENVFKRGKWAALSVSWRGTDGHEELVFDAIDSGRVRADEIARTILRQREYLSRPGL